MASDQTQAIARWRLGHIRGPDGLRGDYPWTNFEDVENYHAVATAVYAGCDRQAPECFELVEVVRAVLRCDLVI